MPASMATAGFFQPVPRERTLFWCVLVSIALHALVLLGISLHDAPAPPSKALLALTARLAPFVAAPQAPVQSQPAPRLPPQAPETVTARHPLVTKSLVSPESDERKAAPAEPAKTLEPVPAPVPPSMADSGSKPAAPVQGRPVPQSNAAAPGGDVSAKSGTEADAGTLDQYRLALIMATRRYKRYPAIAMEKGWQGRVEVRMVIGVDGMVVNASIKAGSGHEILDNQALEMLKQGKTAVPIPANLRGREFSIDVPVIFNLDNPSS
jgi:protein TonB